MSTTHSGTAAPTPGPWQVFGVRHRLGDEDCQQVGPDGFAIAFLPIGRDLCGALADARLIAAAPLMLEALRTTRECLEQANAAGLIADTLWAGDCETLFDHIDAAIAAATGAQGGES
mgnify:CR=1 FL=1